MIKGLKALKGLFTKEVKVSETEMLIKAQQEQINQLMNMLANKNEVASEVCLSTSEEVTEPFIDIVDTNTHSFVRNIIEPVKEYVGVEETNSKLVTSDEDTVQDTLSNFMVAKKTDVVNTNKVKDVDAYESNVNRNGWDKEANFNLADMQGLSLASRDDAPVIRALVEELRTKLYNTKVDDIFDACSEFPPVVLQQYVLTLQLRDNSYQAEYSNLDSLSTDELKDIIAKFSFENFAKVMATKGWTSIAPSEKQIEMLKNNGIDTSRVLTKFKASELIDEISKANGAGKPSEKQVEYLMSLVTKTGYQGYEELDINTKYGTTKAINELQKIADEKFGNDPITEKQQEYFYKLLKRCNKRYTKSVQQEMLSLTQITFKEKIKELKELELKVNPYLSEGQLNFIVSLHQSLGLSYTIEDLKVLPRATATATIERLQRDLLFQNSRLYCVQFTKEQIKAMSKDEVKANLDLIAKERKEKYTK